MQLVMTKLKEIDRTKLTPEENSKLLDLQLELTTSCTCSGHEFNEEAALKRLEEFDK